MPESHHGIHSNLQFPSSIFNIDRKDVPVLLYAPNIQQQEIIAGQLADSESFGDYYLSILYRQPEGH